jgi:hypothetical protein
VVRNIAQIRKGLGTKIKFFENFLTILLTTSYKDQESRIEDFFQPNAQAEAIVEVPSEVEGSSLLRGTCFFNPPLKKVNTKS